jgi:hypothetical protein
MSDAAKYDAEHNRFVRRWCRASSGNSCRNRREETPLRLLTSRDSATVRGKGRAGGRVVVAGELGQLASDPMSWQTTRMTGSWQARAVANAGSWYFVTMTR